MKIKFYDPINKQKILTFTADSYGFNAAKNVYFFKDKFGVYQEFVKELFIGTETNRTEGEAVD